jgi:hypothetical protein
MKLLPLEASAGGIKMLIIKILFTGKRERTFSWSSCFWLEFWVQSMNGELVFDDKPFADERVG